MSKNFNRHVLGSVFKSFLVNFGVKAAQIDDRKLIRIE
jgi:hypothetical protein